MKLKNILFVVKDIEVSKAFYRDLFGLNVISDFGENVVLTEGLVLQEAKLWREFIGRDIRTGGNDAELYFEEDDIEGFLETLKSSHYKIEYIDEYTEHKWGQKVIRIYDPDGHIIEIGESLEHASRRLLGAGMTVEQAAGKTGLRPDQIELFKR